MVLKSNLSVETIALLNFNEIVVYVTSIIKEVSGYPELKINCIMDNKSFMEALFSKNIEDKRLCLDVAMI